MSGQHEARDNTAAVGWMAILGLIFGGAGVLIAALSVGIERAWSGRQGGPGGEGWRRSVADHRAWLDVDRQRRAAVQHARQQWWRAGADPASRPAQPPWSIRVGSAWRRFWARTAVSADRIHAAGGRFGDGFRAGWDAARRARRDGATPWQTARARPADPPVGQPSADQGGGADGQVSSVSTPDPQPEPAPEPAVESGPQVASPADVPEPQQQQSSDTAATADEGVNTVPETTMTTTPAPAGETNLDLIAADLAAIHGHLARVQELNDQMAGERAALEGAVAAANERATVNGATSATQQALDEAHAVVALLSQHLSGVSDTTSQAEDHTSAAQAGLAPARDAQDALHSAGARGEFVSTATSD